MKTFLALFLFPFILQAAQIEIIGACSEDPILKESLDIIPGETLGDFTKRAFKKFQIEYIGSDLGISTIQGLPNENQTFEILSKEKMRAYGWCYLHNNVEPPLYPNEMKMVDNNDTVQWFFAYANYDKGQWLSMCEPSWQIQSSFVCPKD